MRLRGHYKFKNEEYTILQMYWKESEFLPKSLRIIFSGGKEKEIVHFYVRTCFSVDMPDSSRSSLV